jgi:hypothetical protein
MSRRLTPVLLVAAAMALDVASADAGPCTAEIAQFEEAVRQSASTPGAGPMARQSVGAQLDRQPTPGSVKGAEERAQASFDRALARAKRRDAQAIVPGACGR